jgi:hypothetical protein
MQHKQKKLKVDSKKLKVLGVATLLTLAFSLSTVSAQESVNATGGNASGSGGSVSYSVGQFLYTTHTGSNGTVAQGVQQPYEISVLTGLEEAKGINLTVSAFPNPATDYLILEVKDFELSALHFQLFDMNGKLLQNEKIAANQTHIVMSDLMPATYFVKVLVKTQGIANQQEVKTFKIIKQ